MIALGAAAAEAFPTNTSMSRLAYGGSNLLLSAGSVLFFLNTQLPVPIALAITAAYYAFFLITSWKRIKTTKLSRWWLIPAMSPFTAPPFFLYLCLRS
jgi:hypothetical protein